MHEYIQVFEHSTMNIIFPIGGQGNRMKEQYRQPKAFIPVFNMPLIMWVLQHVIPQLQNEDHIFIVTLPSLRSYFESTVAIEYPSIQFIYLDNCTSGAAETLTRGVSHIIQNNPQRSCLPTICMDCDTCYTSDILDRYRNSVQKNVVYYTTNQDPLPLYSYIKLSPSGEVIEIQEKNKISDNANTGIYCFRNLLILEKYTNLAVMIGKEVGKECYTSMSIDAMIRNDETVSGIMINDQYVFNLGTPDQFQHFCESRFAFLFDLDGTLVQTDDIYFSAWKCIVKEYDIDLTKEMFDICIHGKPDMEVVQLLLPDVLHDISLITNKKDAYVLDNIKQVIPILGADIFLKSIYQEGHPIVIVTNSNRSVAEAIVDHCGWKSRINGMIVGAECRHPKPYPDPYVNALELLGIPASRAIIFEDSKSGLLSAKAVSPRCVVGMESLYKQSVLLDYGADMTLPHFMNVDYTIISNTNHCKEYHAQLTSWITSSMNKNRSETCTELQQDHIYIHHEKLKGGFIADVYAIEIRSNPTQSCVFKVKSNRETFLTNMSAMLHLYEREFYFYDKISRDVPLQVPSYVGLIQREHDENVGILLENLCRREDMGQFELNLSQEPREVTSQVIDGMVRMHKQYWNQPLQSMYPQLKYHNNYPCMVTFVQKQFPEFYKRWSGILTEKQMSSVKYGVDNFQEIQERLSHGCLTLCHGDIKSGNIFFYGKQKIPIFCDWQYVSIGKGSQDLVFFLIESFDIPYLKTQQMEWIQYYYDELDQKEYTLDEYLQDLADSAFYFPLFVALWFGTIAEDELIDKHFPRRFIERWMSFVEQEM